VVGAPAIAPDGARYVGTIEGAVHALAPDGSFRWTFNVPDALAGALAVGPSGVVYAGTIAGNVHAILPAGKALWSFAAQAPVVSDLIATPDGAVHFVTQDRLLYGISARGGALYTVVVRTPVTAGPALGLGGEVLLGISDGSVIAFLQQRQRRTELEGAVLDLAMRPDGSLWAVTESGLAVLDRSGTVRWRVPGARYAGRGAGGVGVVWKDGQLVWYRADGTEIRSARLRAAPSAPLAVDAAGCTWVATESGDAIRVRPDGSMVRVPVDAAPLGRPQVDGARAQVVMVAPSGTVVGIEACREGG
jgi:outer membrane protein assembly factor BamB